MKFTSTLAGSDPAATARAELPAQAHTGKVASIMEREDGNKRYAEAGFIWSVEANRFLVAEAVNTAPGSAIDLAAGEGRSAVRLAERGWKVRAVDFSDVALAKGKNPGGGSEWVICLKRSTRSRRQS